MAGKKPAKPMAGQTKQTVLDPNIYGNLIKYIGQKNNPCVCSKCKREVIRGIVRLKNDNFFCSTTCAKNG